MHEIQAATENDIPLIRELTFRVWPQTYALLLSPDQISYMLDMMYSEASLQRQMKEGCTFIIVREDNEPAGFASYQQTGPGLFKLHKLYVLPNQQGKGTGRLMIDYIIHEIQQQGATRLQLQVKRDNKARFFYEKLGFSIIEEADFDIGNGYLMKDYIMQKTIS